MKKILFLITCLIVLNLIQCDNSDPRGCIYDYFPMKPGWHLEYDMTTTGAIYTPGTIYITFQEASLFNEIEYIDNSANLSGCGSAILEVDHDWIFRSSNNVTGYNDHLIYNIFLNLPANFYNRRTYKYNGVVFTVETNQTSSNGIAGCLKIIVNALNCDWTPFISEGDYYLAENIGIVYLNFIQRINGGRWGDDGEYIRYQLISYEKVGRGTITGRIVDNSSKPLINTVVTPCIYATCEDKWLVDRTIAAGNFSIDFFYKPGMPLTRYVLGYDQDDPDGYFDDNPAVSNYSLNALTAGHHDLGDIIY